MIADLYAMIADRDEVIEKVTKILGGDEHSDAVALAIALRTQLDERDATIAELRAKIAVAMPEAA